MGRSKQEKFRDNAVRRNVIEPGKPEYHTIKGNWKNIFFTNDKPIMLELACGKGTYTVGLARLFPGNNYIGVDIKGSRIWTGSKEAEKEGLQNVAFLRIQIQQLENFFEEDEVDGIWITFPDPRPKKSDIRQRLTSPRFLNSYKKIMKPGSLVCVKTDNKELYEYSLETLSTFEGVTGLIFTDDLYASELKEDHFGLMTDYEKKFLEAGIKIKYLKFRMMK